MNDVRVLSTADLQQGLDRDSGLHVLNVQTDQFFAGELIPGSRHIPLDGIEQGVRALPKDADATLRHRPDRILVGEVRGAEAFDLLQALNTGHMGSLSTIHANSAEQALTRMAHCVLMANVGLPHASIREAIALAIHRVVHLERVADQRRVTQVVEVRGYDARSDQFSLEHVAGVETQRQGVAA